MRYRLSLLAWILAVAGAVASGTTAGMAQAETVDKLAVVYSCETPDCSDADGQMEPMVGASITSYDVDGNEVDSCTTDDFGQCSLTIPAAEDGSYDVVAGPGFESYLLLSSTPESTGEGDDGRVWTFVPSEEESPPGAPVNVLYCDDADCSSPMTMDGAVVESYQAGEWTDSCTVSSAADDFDGCRLFIGADDIGFAITPAEGFEDYVLVSETPEVFETEREGVTERVYVWTFIPAEDGEVDPEPTVVTPGTGEGSDDETEDDSTVTTLPETGAGITAPVASHTSLTSLSFALVFALIAYGMVMRQRR